MTEFGIVYEKGEVSEGDLKRISSFLNKMGIEYRLYPENSVLCKNGYFCCENLRGDYIFVIGGDKIVLKTLLGISDREIPLVSFYGRKTRGFFPIAGVDSFSDVVRAIISGNFMLEEKIRLCAKVGDKELPPALNELAIFSKESGSIIRYTLCVGNEIVWRDVSDGVIVSTPTGSTAYALSAGGPIVREADVFVIVSVNSLLPTHRPIVTSSDKIIYVEDLLKNENVIVIDGQVRRTIDSDTVTVYKSKYKAKFLKINMENIIDLDARLSKRMNFKRTYVQLEGLPPSAKLVYKILEYEGPLNRIELISRTGLPSRTVDYALNLLVGKGVVVRKQVDKDARMSIYAIL
ncbi:MAG: hypothetical protein N3F64_05380 [Nitrososphaeria archaeon]|nr:hypothetical protein [Nitrososphaeria archaeon]